jgi:hypothetical protein
MAEVIPIGSDHAGFQLKQRLVEELRALGYEPLDLGTNSVESVEYPAEPGSACLGSTTTPTCVGEWPKSIRSTTDES